MIANVAPEGRLSELWRFRPFIGNQVTRELNKTYRGSLLGWIWSLIHPLMTLAVYAVAFGVILKVDRFAPEGGKPDSFAHYLFSALVIWQTFSSVSNGAMSAFQRSVDLRKRIYFPPEVPGISSTLAALVSSGLELVVLVIAYAAFGNINVTFLHLLPITAFTAVLGLGVGLLLSTANVRFADVGYIYNIILRFLFFLTPMIYPFQLVVDANENAANLVRLNPLYHLTDAARQATYLQSNPSLVRYLYIAATSLGVLALGWWVFERTADNVSEGN
jgi:ABC-type polysaccharide/polyol phosphate export permease